MSPIVFGLLHLFFSPQLSAEFLFLYFGISIAVSVAVWSTLILATEAKDKLLIYPAWILFGLATLFALLAAITGPTNAGLPLDASVTGS